MLCQCICRELKPKNFWGKKSKHPESPAIKDVVLNIPGVSVFVQVSKNNWFIY